MWRLYGLATGLIFVVLYGTFATGEVPKDSAILEKFDALISYSTELREEYEKESSVSTGDDTELENEKRPIRFVFLERTRATLDEVSEIADGDRVAIFRNFALAMHARELTEDEFHATWLVHSQLKEHLGVSAEEMLRAGIPLWDSEDQTARRAGFTCFDAAFGAAHDRPDFTLSFLRAQKSEGTEPSGALIDYMIQFDKAGAFSDLRKLFETTGERDDRLAEMETLLKKKVESVGGALRRETDPEEVAAALSAMADDPAWWVRLCIAELMRLIPEVRVPEVIDRLRSDENPRVRASIAGLDAWKDESKRAPRYRIHIDERDTGGAQ